PAGMSTAAWDAVWANLRPRLSNTVGDLYTLLFNDASNLAQNGAPIRSINQLFAFEVRQADDEAPSRPTFQAVDLAFPAPGLPLVFGRPMVETVSGRYTSGRFGFGWVDNFDISASVDSAKQVTIHQGVTDRVFDLKPDGTYVGAPDDTGTLTKI